MQINISLPRPGSFDGTKEVESFLKQLELSVHHAQKSLKEMVQMENESGIENPEFSCLYRIKNVEDSSSGERFEIGEHAYSESVEIEIYN